MVSAARLQSGVIEPRLSVIDLGPLLLEAMRRWQGRFDRSQITIRRSGGDGVLVRADAELVHQVLDALLNNALRFTAAGGRVELSVAVEARVAQVRVRDNGIGISDEQMQRLIQPFSRIGAGGPDVEPGRVGLGLYLSRLLVELLGGRLQIESDGPGKGTDVRFGLPLSETNPVGGPSGS
jgi:signal transduction histidine kinase